MIGRDRSQRKLRDVLALLLIVGHALVDILERVLKAV